MSERRTKRYIGRIQKVHYYPNGTIPHEMMAIADSPVHSGQFFFNGSTIFFSDSDLKLKKEVFYESCEQVQRTSRNSKEMRLRP